MRAIPKPSRFRKSSIKKRHERSIGERTGSQYDNLASKSNHYSPHRLDENKHNQDMQTSFAIFAASENPSLSQIQRSTSSVVVKVPTVKQKERPPHPLDMLKLLHKKIKNETL